MRSMALDMRDPMLALFGSMLLVLATLLAAPSDVEAKGKWPMSWANSRKTFTSKAFVVSNRPWTVLQYHVGTLVARKKPGRDRCVARVSMFQPGNAGPEVKLTNRSRRAKVIAAVWQWDMSEAPKKLFMRIRVRTNGNCVWAFALSGPRKGEAPMLP
jgi:hypothetical protein